MSKVLFAMRIERAAYLIRHKLRYPQYTDIIPANSSPSGPDFHLLGHHPPLPPPPGLLQLQTSHSNNNKDNDNDMNKMTSRSWNQNDGYGACVIERLDL